MGSPKENYLLNYTYRNKWSQCTDLNLQRVKIIIIQWMISLTLPMMMIVVVIIITFRPSAFKWIHVTKICQIWNKRLSFSISSILVTMTRWLVKWMCRPSMEREHEGPADINFFRYFLWRQLSKQQISRCNSKWRSVNFQLESERRSGLQVKFRTPAPHVKMG